jgi:hypothetical protein
MSILSLSFTAITETDVVDCFMQVRFEVLPVVTMSETPTAMAIMRAYNKGSKFL